MGILKSVSIIAGTPGPQGDPGPQGNPGVQGNPGAQGAPGIVPMYNQSGLMNSPKAFTGTTTTGSGGTWSINYAVAGFTAAPNVQVQAVSSDGTLTNATGCSVTGISATGASGIVFRAQALSVLGLLPIIAVGAGVTLQIMAVGV